MDASLSSQAGPSPHDDELVPLMMAAAAGRYERVISWLRVAFCIANLSLSSWIWERLGDADIATFVVPIGLLVVAFTLVLALIVEHLVRRGAPVSGRLLAISVATDIAITFAALLVNPYWAKDGYYGLLRSPDIGVLLLLVIASGFRLHFSLSVLSGSIASVIYQLLLWADDAWAGEYVRTTIDHEVRFALEIVSATALACAISIIGRGLVERVAKELLEEQRSGRRARAFFMAFHPLEKAVGNLAFAVDSEGCARDEELRQRMSTVRECCRGVRKSAEEAVPDEGIMSVELRKTLDDTTLEIRGMLEYDVTLSMSDETPLGTMVEIYGGHVTLRNMIMCLVLNATEGSGDALHARRARNVEIHAAVDWLRPYIRIDVRDDGPGFARQSRLGRASTKGEGHGATLLTVRKLLTLTLGNLRCRNLRKGGAEVSLWFRGGKA